MKKYFLLLSFFYVTFHGNAQYNMDSLLNLSKTGKNDSIRSYALYQYGIQYALRGQFDSAFPIIQKAKNQFFKQNNLSLAGIALRDLGEIFMHSEKNDSALVYFIHAEKILRKTNKKVALGRVIMSIGQMKSQRGEIVSAKKYYYEAASLFKQAKEWSQLGSIYQHLGGLYLNEKINNKPNDSCKYYYSKCLELQLKTGNEYRIALAYANIASMEREYLRINEALIYNEKASAIFKKLNKNSEWAATMINSAEFSMALNKYDHALEILNEAESILAKSFNKEYRLVLYSNLSKCYLHKLNYQKAYKYQAQVLALKDSIFNESNSKQITEMEKKYELDKKEGEILFLNKESELRRIELRQKSLTLWVVLGGLALTLLLSLLLFNNNKKRKKALEIIKNQNLMLEQKNKDITDSIVYARRIQEALLPSENVLPELFPHSFVIYKPRDIVSGDFFWLGTTNNKKVAAVCDCTGHGVPGAFMSLIGHEILNRVILDEKTDCPSEILRKTHYEIGFTLNKSSKDYYDGMDCAILVYDEINKSIQYSGAYRNLIMIRNNELKEIAGNKTSLGGRNTEEKKEFIHHDIKIQNGDLFYIYSDGFVDQFGGLSGKKFMHKQFKNTLLQIHNLKPEAQKNQLVNIFETWKGDHEQIDDVCIIGIQINFST